MSVTILQRQPRVVVVRQAGGVVKVVKQMIAGPKGDTGATGANGAAGPNSVSDATALGALTETAAPLFLLSSNAAGTAARKTTPGASGLSLLLAANRAAVLALLGTGTPSASNFLRGDGSWQSVSASPGGSDTQVQFNDGGAFGGDSGLVFNKTTDTLTSGLYVTADASSRVIVGQGNGTPTGTGHVLVGRANSVSGSTDDSFAIGISNTVTARVAGAIGRGCSTGIVQGFSLGNSCTVGSSVSESGLAIGSACSVTAGTNPIAIGRSVTVSHRAIGIGETHSSDADGDVGICVLGVAPFLKLRSNSTTTNGRTVGGLRTGWQDQTDATRLGFAELGAYSTTTFQVGVRVEANSAGVRLGLYGSAAVERQASPAALAGAATLADVITAFNSLRTALIASTLLKA